MPSCLVRLATGVERLVPIEVTDLTAMSAAVFPVPLDLSSLHNLIKTFAHVQAQLKREGADERARNKPPATKHRSSGSGVEQPQPVTTEAGSTNHRPDLSGSRHSMEPGGEK